MDPESPDTKLEKDRQIVEIRLDHPFEIKNQYFLCALNARILGK